MKLCADCKFFEQGKTCSFCGNPKQANQEYKNYVYYTFGCELHEEGLAESRRLYIQRSIKKTKEEIGLFQKTVNFLAGQKKKTMKSKLIILLAMAFCSCKKEYDCTLRIQSVYITPMGEADRNEWIYHLPFQGSRKEMLAYEKEETKIFAKVNHSGMTIMQTNLMVCK